MGEDHLPLTTENSIHCVQSETTLWNPTVNATEEDKETDTGMPVLSDYIPLHDDSSLIPVYQHA